MSRDRDEPRRDDGLDANQVLLPYMVINNVWSTHQDVVNRPRCTMEAFECTGKVTKSTPPAGDLGSDLGRILEILEKPTKVRPRIVTSI